MMERISANGIDEVCDVKMMTIHEFGGIDDGHGPMGSKKALVHSVHMRDFGKAVKIKYLARYLLCACFC